MHLKYKNGLIGWTAVFLISINFQQMITVGISKHLPSSKPADFEFFDEHKQIKTAHFIYLCFEIKNLIPGIWQKETLYLWEACQQFYQYRYWSNILMTALGRVKSSSSWSMPVVYQYLFESNILMTHSFKEFNKIGNVWILNLSQNFFNLYKCSSIGG